LKVKHSGKKTCYAKRRVGSNMLEVQVWIKFNIQDSFDYVQFILRKLWIFNQFNENKFGTNLSQMCT